jgi:hypothetical protein
MLERWAEHQEWWQSIPFGWLSLMFKIFWLGVLLQDLLNEKSA